MSMSLAAAGLLALLPFSVEAPAAPEGGTAAQAPQLHGKPAGRSNAFDDMWLLPYAIPAEEKSAVVNADLERINARLADPALDAQVLGTDALASSAIGRYPQRAPLPARPRLCGHGNDCLAQIRLEPESYVALVERNTAWLAQHRELTRHDHFRNRLQPHHLAPGLPMTSMNLPLTAAALDFVQGRTGSAMTAVCDQTRGWRRIGANSDSLLVTMLATGQVRAHAALYAEMLADLPPDTAEPATCKKAFAAASADELSLCTAMTGETAMLANGYRATSIRLNDNTVDSANYDADRTIARVQRTLGWFCSTGALAALEKDSAVQLPRPETDASHPECQGNATGCTLADTGLAAYDTHLARRQDMAAQLRLVEALRALRSECEPGQVEACLARINAGSPARPVELVDEGTALRIALRDGRSQAHWQEALPPYLVTR